MIKRELKNNIKLKDILSFIDNDGYFVNIDSNINITDIEELKRSGFTETTITFNIDNLLNICQLIGKDNKCSFKVYRKLILPKGIIIFCS